MNLVFARMGNSDGSPVPTTYNNEIWTYLLKIICNNTAIDETAERRNSIHIFPNPTADLLYFKEKMDWQKTDLQVFDIHGRQLTLPFEDNAIDVSGLENGVYFVNLRTEMQVQMLKFEVLR
jgi:hypothetical protein